MVDVLVDLNLEVLAEDLRSEVSVARCLMTDRQLEALKLLAKFPCAKGRRNGMWTISAKVAKRLMWLGLADRAETSGGRSMVKITKAGRRLNERLNA